MKPRQLLRAAMSAPTGIISQPMQICPNCDHPAVRGMGPTFIVRSPGLSARTLRVDDGLCLVRRMECQYCGSLFLDSFAWLSLVDARYFGRAIRTGWWGTVTQEEIDTALEEVAR